MERSRLLIGLAGAFAAMTAALAVAGAVSNPAIFAPAALFGVVTYFLWMHGTGRLATRVYRRVQQRAAANGGRDPRRERVNRGPRAGRERTRRTTRGRESRSGGSPVARREAREILGVGPDADPERIEAAYRERVKEVHPDADGGDSEAFKRVQRAYERLQE